MSPIQLIKQQMGFPPLFKIKGLIVLRVAWSIQGKRWPFKSWNEKFTKIQKYHPYTPKTFYFLFFIYKTPVVESHPTTSEIRDLLRPRSTPDNCWFFELMLV